MVRPLRNDYPGAIHHVTSRGNNGDAIFLSAKDRLAFLRILTEATSKLEWIIHAYCLMNNHYHLLLETPETNLSKGMQFLNGTYTQNHNRVHKIKGHLFQGRFWSHLVEENSYFLEIARYVVLNPIRANLVRSPEMFPWSSYLETAGWRDKPKFSSPDFLLSFFSDHTECARELYIQFVYQNTGNGLRRESDGQTERKLICTRDTDTRVAFSSMPIDKPLISEILSGAENRQERNLRIRQAHYEYSYKLNEIAEYLGVRSSALSMMLKRLTEKSEVKK